MPSPPTPSRLPVTTYAFVNLRSTRLDSGPTPVFEDWPAPRHGSWLPGTRTV
ncbi:hypothetical protein [Streptosporangium sp. NPDC002721]|uniref:hypothetical protein n=1 Tax=Streptosporangium sp. NPDC002721 TaxID=3366188 RepID=UPI00367863E1